MRSLLDKIWAEKQSSRAKFNFFTGDCGFGGDSWIKLVIGLFSPVLLAWIEADLSPNQQH